MKKITVKPYVTIRETMEILSRTGEKCLLVIDDTRKLLGTITDGDLRRGILNNKEFTTSIEEIYNRNPITLTENKFSKNEAGDLLVKNKLTLIPVLDSKGRLSDFIT